MLKGLKYCSSFENTNMIFFDLINKSNTVSKLLNEILRINDCLYKQIDSKTVPLTTDEFKCMKVKVELLIQSEKDKSCILLVRGESNKKLNSKFNKGEFSKIFSIGEKAQNYLVDMNVEREDFKTINDVSQKTMEWIFDQYAVINWGQSRLQKYFQTSINKNAFVDKLINNEKYRDYYLYGLQTEGSNRKVFFVSSSTSPKKALYDERRKILILFWIPEPHIEYAQSKSSLSLVHSEIRSNGLPNLFDSYFPKEKEFSIKGAIFPDFIYAIIDVDNNIIIISPKLLINEQNWIKV